MSRATRFFIVFIAIIFSACVNAYESKKIEQIDIDFIKNNWPGRVIALPDGGIGPFLQKERDWILNRNGVYQLKIQSSTNVKFIIMIVRDGLAKTYYPQSDEQVEELILSFTYLCPNKSECIREDEYMTINTTFSNGEVIKETTKYGDTGSTEITFKNNRPTQKKGFYNGYTLYITNYKYQNDNRREECTYGYHYRDNAKGTILYISCTPFIGDKKDGKERNYDEKNLLTRERLYKNGKIIHTISKNTWHMTRGGTKEIDHYFDAISKIEDGLCVTRKLSDGSHLETKAAHDFDCADTDDPAASEAFLLSLPPAK